MTEQQQKMWQVLTSGEIDAETVARLFTDYHVCQLLSDGFAQFLVDEGVCSAEDVGIEDEGEVDDE